MADYTETNYERANAHLRHVCAISLSASLTSGRWRQLKAWSILTPLVLLCRYSEKLDYNIKIYDMVASGHLSHKSGTDLDFGYDESTYRKKAAHQVRIIKDMLELKSEITRLSSKIEAFRLGFYFDRFDNDTNLRAMEKATDKVAKFDELYGHRTNVTSMHLGLRYNYTTSAYRGKTMSSAAGKYAFWGQGSEGFHRGRRWAKVFREMDGNLTSGQATLIASNVIRDFEALDRNDPTVAPGRDPVKPFVPFENDPSETVWV